MSGISRVRYVGLRDWRSGLIGKPNLQEKDPLTLRIMSVLLSGGLGLINEPPPLSEDYNEDPNIKGGVTNHGSTLGSVFPDGNSSLGKRFNYSDVLTPAVPARNRLLMSVDLHTIPERVQVVCFTL